MQHVNNCSLVYVTETIGYMIQYWNIFLLIKIVLTKISHWGFCFLVLTYIKYSDNLYFPVSFNGISSDESDNDEVGLLPRTMNDSEEAEISHHIQSVYIHETSPAEDTRNVGLKKP